MRTQQEVMESYWAHENKNRWDPRMIRLAEVENAPRGDKKENPTEEDDEDVDIHDETAVPDASHFEAPVMPQFKECPACQTQYTLEALEAGDVFVECAAGADACGATICSQYGRPSEEEVLVGCLFCSQSCEGIIFWLL